MEGPLENGSGLDSRMVKHRRASEAHTGRSIYHLALIMAASDTLQMGRRLEASGYPNAVEDSDGGVRRGPIGMH